MSEEVQGNIFDVFSRQHEMYAELTAKGLQFPINLVLTLNASALGSFFLFNQRSEAGEGASAMVVSVASFWCFAMGVASVLIAAFFQWQLYENVMMRKRKLLAATISATTYAEAVHVFRFEADNFGWTYKGYLCYVFVVLSYLLLVLGIYFNVPFD